jgi:hypothetical protein
MDTEEQLRASWETNTRLNRRIGQLQHELARLRRQAHRGVVVAEWAMRMWRDRRDYFKRLRVDNWRMRALLDDSTLWGRLRRLLGLWL